jgi:hypothetical protein
MICTNCDLTKLKSSISLPNHGRTSFRLSTVNAHLRYRCFRTVRLSAHSSWSWLTSKVTKLWRKTISTKCFPAKRYFRTFRGDCLQHSACTKLIRYKQTPSNSPAKITFFSRKLAIIVLLYCRNNGSKWLIRKMIYRWWHFHYPLNWGNNCRWNRTPMRMSSIPKSRKKLLITPKEEQTVKSESKEKCITDFVFFSIFMVIAFWK